MKYEKTIFVFGSNLAGRHGRGAALIARRFHGAVYGQGEGLQGNSYAVPTKGLKMEILPLNTIKANVDRLMRFATKHPEYLFKITALGTGLAGYSHEDIAPMFFYAPTNCVLPSRWRVYLPEVEGRRWWFS